MMHRSVNVLLLTAVFTFSAFVLSAQGKKQTDPQAKNDKKGAKLIKPTVYLGQSDYSGGPIKKELFNAYLKQGLSSHDSLGHKYKVIGFSFGYAEHNIYEDSIGNIVPMTDYSFEYCPGDTISSDIADTKNTAITNYIDGNPDNNDVSKSIYNRVKPGDTVFFDQVRLVKFISGSQSLPDTTAIFGKSIVCWIVK